MKLELKVFIVQDCPNCAEAQAIAQVIEQDYPHVQIEIIDIADQQAAVPETVFATPTFMLNNRIVSLGNPKRSEMARWIKEADTQPI